uniref:Uncharacterized protein n=1 Tax=Arundo donax TaxID=35708 RepID=A0A0A9A3B4_ARUDO
MFIPSIMSIWFCNIHCI